MKKECSTIMQCIYIYIKSKPKTAYRRSHPFRSKAREIVVSGDMRHELHCQQNSHRFRYALYWMTFPHLHITNVHKRFRLRNPLILCEWFSGGSGVFSRHALKKHEDSWMTLQATLFDLVDRCYAIVYWRLAGIQSTLFIA